MSHLSTRICLFPVKSVFMCLKGAIRLATVSLDCNGSLHGWFYSVSLSQ